MSQVQRHGQHIHYPDCHCDQTRVAWWAEVCVERISWTVDKRAPPALCTSLDRAQANTSCMLGIITDTRLLVASLRTMWTKKG